MAIYNPAIANDWWVRELPRLTSERPDLLQRLVHGLLENDTELRWSVVIQAYQERRINLGKAAELLGVPELVLRERFVELGIPLRIGPVNLDEARAEVEAVRAWYDEQTERST